MRYIITISTAILLLLTSCLPEPIETEIEQAESKIVVSSQVIPGNFMLVTVSRSFSALEGSYGADLDQEDLDQFLVKDAIVVLSYANRVDTLINSPDAPGVYASLLRLEDANQTFELYVYDPKTKESVTANSTMLDRVNLETVTATTSIAPLIDDTIYTMNYTFTDPPEDNWYVVNVFDPNNLQVSFNFLGNESDQVYTQLVSDQSYDGSTIEFSSEIIGYDFKDTVTVMFSNISESYFRFLDARQRGGGIISSVTGEPINHPTNVQGGYGYFNTHNPSLTQVILDE